MLVARRPIFVYIDLSLSFAAITVPFGPVPNVAVIRTNTLWGNGLWRALDNHPLTRADIRSRRNSEFRGFFVKMR